MAVSSTNGTIVTFYSWKGGVGRTMALANIAVQLARRGRSVLMVDWDLEAPGLERYFSSEVADIRRVPAEIPTGLMGLLREADAGIVEPLHWESRLDRIFVPPAVATYRTPSPPTPGQLHMLPSGIRSSNYSECLGNFSWDKFFAEQKGGEWLEMLRYQWMERYEFVLIDARTGLADSSGVCTIQMPDMLVLVFTSNDQSLDGGLKIISSIQNSRNQFAYDRSPLAIVPLLSRWCGDEEIDLGDLWMCRFDEVLAPIVSSWLPADFTPRQLLEKIRIPHLARFSFGEPLPVLTHSLTDPSLPGVAFDNVAGLLSSRLAEAAQIIDPTFAPRFKAGFDSNEELEFLTLVQNSADLHKEIARLERIGTTDGSELIDFLNKAGLALVRLARHANAEPLFRRALTLCEQTYEPEHPTVAICLDNLAKLLHASNRPTEAEPIMRRALAIDEKNLGPDHPIIASRLNSLGQILKDINRLAEAEPMMRRALAIVEQNFGPDDPNVSVDLSNLALLLQSTNRLAEAEPMMRRALAITEKTYGPEHPDVAVGLHNLAMLLQARNRVAEAEPMMRRALAIDEQNFGQEHPNVAIRLNNLAQLLRVTNRAAEAEPIKMRALAIDEQSYGPDQAYRLAITSQFIEKAQDFLEKRAYSYQRSGKIFQGIAFAIICLGAVYACWHMINNERIHFNSWLDFFSSFTSAFIAYGLIVLATAGFWRYSRAMLDQSERLFERQHALRKGHFFVNLNDGNLTIDEMERAFMSDTSHFNAFTNIDSETSAPWGELLKEFAKDHPEILNVDILKAHKEKKVNSE